jgi:hypothetical protein
VIVLVLLLVALAAAEAPPARPPCTASGAPTGRAGGAFEYRGDRVWAVLQHMRVGPDAETGMGFVSQTDIRRTTTGAS